MTDRELIERAAKAAGLEIATARQAERDAAIGREAAGLWLKDCKTWWNPLADDGDAARLAVKLKFAVNIWGPGVVVSCSPRIDVESFGVETGNDPYAATRRAIVLAAAAIAESQDQSA